MGCGEHAPGPRTVADPVVRHPPSWALALTVLAYGQLPVAGAVEAQTAPQADGAHDAVPTALVGLRFQNLSVSVSDLSRASAWYRDVLDFKEVRTGEFPSVGARFIFLEGNGMQLELISSGKARIPNQATNPPGHLETTGYKTLVFNTPNLTALTDHLVRKGVRIVWKEQKLADGMSSTMIHDVEGNLINIFGPSQR